MLPIELGFRMPGEWEKRGRTFMEWPTRESLWTDGIMDAKIGYANIAMAISQFEEIVIIAKEGSVNEVNDMCRERVKILSMEHDDSWMRDNGPTFLINKNNELAGINWIFNAWGNKYHPYDKDDEVAKKVLDVFNIKSFNAPIVLEGGSIHVDGEGTLVTTEECLLNKNRNPELGKKEITEVLKNYLGIQKIIWLKTGLYGDETDGHVDNVACFARPGVIVTQVCRDKNDPNYARTLDNINILKDSNDAKGRKLQIIEIQQPPVRFFKGKRLVLSYLNYYPVDGGIIVPVFGKDAKETDNEAIGVLQKLYPDRKIVPVDGIPIIKGGGNVHCITQQMPLGKICIGTKL